MKQNNDNEFLAWEQYTLMLRHLTLKKHPYEDKYWTYDSMNCTGGLNNRRRHSMDARCDWHEKSGGDSFQSLDATNFMPVGSTKQFFHAIERAR